MTVPRSVPEVLDGHVTLEGGSWTGLGLVETLAL
jgi:hypothetical protein